MSFLDRFYSLRFLHNFLGFLLSIYVRLLGKTCNYVVEGKEHYEIALSSGRPVIFTLWHQQLLPLVSYGWKVFDLQKFIIFAEGGDRGNILSILGKHINTFRTIKIDMKGELFLSGRLVIEFIRLVNSGKNAMLTPDGPYGPAFIAKPGTVFIARKTRAVLIPCGGWAKISFKLRRWDRYLLLLPFSEVNIVFGKPIYIENNMSELQVEQLLDKGLHSARNRAQVLCGIKDISEQDLPRSD